MAIFNCYLYVYQRVAQSVFSSPVGSRQNFKPGQPQRFADLLDLESRNQERVALNYPLVNIQKAIENGDL